MRYTEVCEQRFSGFGYEDIELDNLVSAQISVNISWTAYAFEIRVNDTFFVKIRQPSRDPQTLVVGVLTYMSVYRLFNLIIEAHHCNDTLVTSQVRHVIAQSTLLHPFRHEVRKFTSLQEKAQQRQHILVLKLRPDVNLSG